jgi:hypothetical protein
LPDDLDFNAEVLVSAMNHDPAAQTETDRARALRWAVGLILLIGGAAFNSVLEDFGAGLAREWLLLIAFQGGLIFAVYEIGGARLRALWTTRRITAIACVFAVFAVVLFLSVRALRERAIDPKRDSQHGQAPSAPPVASEAHRPQPEPAPPTAPFPEPSKPVLPNRQGGLPLSSGPMLLNEGTRTVRRLKFDALNPAAFDPNSPAVLIVSGDGHDRGLSTSLATAVHGTDTLFTADFLASGDLSRIRDGDVSMLVEADLARATSMLVIGSVSRSTKNDEVAGQRVYQTTTSLVVRVYRPRGSPRVGSFAQSGIGSGFDERASIAAADASVVRRIADQLLSRHAGAINND